MRICVFYIGSAERSTTLSGTWRLAYDGNDSGPLHSVEGQVTDANKSKLLLAASARPRAMFARGDWPVCPG